MKGIDLDKLLKIQRELRDATKVSIKIDHGEVVKITVRDLIAKRNSHGNEIRDAFDKVLRYYIDEKEFKKYVLEGKPIK